MTVSGKMFSVEKYFPRKATDLLVLGYHLENVFLIQLFGSH